MSVFQVYKGLYKKGEQMTNLESIVPPLELCKQIPKGAFADSALEWVTCGDTEPKYKAVDKRHFPYIPEEGALVYPAPTLAEILEALENHGRVYTQRDDDGWTVMLEIAGDEEGYGYDAKIERDTAKPETAALRLWLQINKRSEGSTGR